MNDLNLQRRAMAKFSLRHLLVATAIIAMVIAVGLSYRKNVALKQKRSELLSTSNSLQIKNENQLASTALPRFADNFYSWQVFVPNGLQYELRLGIGAISAVDVPPVADKIRLNAGQHRVTLEEREPYGDKFHFLVYLDGELVFDRTMGNEWLAFGKSALNGFFALGPKHLPNALQLKSKSYNPKFDFENKNPFNRMSDNYVTRLGYQLWIDQTDRTYQAGSPFIWFGNDSQRLGIGLRDGLRLLPSSSSHLWTLMCPKLESINPVLRIEADFLTSENGSFLAQNKGTYSWEILRSSDSDPAQSARSVRMKAIAASSNTLQPIVEMKWDAGRPDEVAFRLADTEENAKIKKWTLRMLDGSHHLWRKLKTQDKSWISPKDAVEARAVPEKSIENQQLKAEILDFSDHSPADVHLQWQTNETIPLQHMWYDPSGLYKDLKPYDGLPVSFRIQIPEGMKPKIFATILDQHPNVPGMTFPGGPVFEAVEIELDANSREWIWLGVRMQE